jgi:hypothetical protein
MEFTPYANLQTSQGETLVLVPVADLRAFEMYEQQAAKNWKPEPCNHPEDSLAATEFLPDVAVCERCGSLVKAGDESGVWVKMTLDELEAAIIDRIGEAMNRIDTAISELHSDPVEWLVLWANEQARRNPVAIERKRIEREKARAAYYANAAK